MITEQFTNLKNILTSKFNSSGQASSNPSLLSQVLGQVTGAQQQ
jgi:hypothetical protein